MMRRAAALPCRLGPGFYQWLGANAAFLRPAVAPAAGIWQGGGPPAALLPPTAAALARRWHNSEAAPAPRPLARHCWQCGIPLATSDNFFCPSCNSIQPADPDPQYFSVFGLDASSFDIDIAELERRYKDLQRHLHPDKYSTASELEQEYSRQQAAVVNTAYDVLKKPLRRAHYILQERGLGACEGMTITDPELLSYVMEAREEVESAGRDPGALRSLLEQNRALEDKCLAELAAAFGAGDLDRAAELTTQLRYLSRIQEAIIEQL